MKSRIKLNAIRSRRATRSRAKILGTAVRPRLAVFRSNRSISVQLIDDSRQHTMAAISGLSVARADGAAKMNKSALAARVGQLIAEKARAAGVTQAVFDRRHYRYHGRVKALAEAARAAGLSL